ncbi:MAG: hypothetical protein MZV64_18955 [Ignavibacteriales bacterium]|nr:hypothetical protein [Ignavibacteriales bacterium]
MTDGKTAVSAQHDDLVVLERVGDLVRHLRRARGEFFGHYRDLFQQICRPRYRSGTISSRDREKAMAVRGWQCTIASAGVFM